MAETCTETPAESPQNRIGAPTGNVSAQDHGFYSAKGFLERGLCAIPADSPLSAAVADLRQEIYEDLGGRENLSRLTIDLIESYICTQLLERGIDAYGFELQSAGLSVIDRRSHKLRDLFASQRTSLVRLKHEIAKTLGLKRVQRTVRQTCPCGRNCFETSDDSLGCAGCGKFPTLCNCERLPASSESDAS